jgi:hypothetical protein
MPAAANDGNNHVCGYGYAYGHPDNESQQGENHESAQAENGNCNEDQNEDTNENADENAASVGVSGEDSHKATTVSSHGSNQGKSGSTDGGDD